MDADCFIAFAGRKLLRNKRWTDLTPGLAKNAVALPSLFNYPVDRLSKQINQLNEV